MSLAIDQFYDELSELLDTPLYLAADTSELEKEITENSHGISVNLSIINDVDTEDLEHFLLKLKEAVFKHSLTGASAAGLTFYLWYEDGHLWYSFINAAHARLAFSEDFTIVSNEAVVVAAFLSSLKSVPVVTPTEMYIEDLIKE